MQSILLLFNNVEDISKMAHYNKTKDIFDSFDRTLKALMKNLDQISSIKPLFKNEMKIILEIIIKFSTK